MSLIELTVVLALVAILGSLLLALVSKGQRQAQGLICLNHLRQWGLATQWYIHEADGMLPPEGSPNGLSRERGWYVTLPALLGLELYHEAEWRTNASTPLKRSLWHCPSNDRRSNGRNLFQYCLNGQVDGSGNRDLPISILGIAAPSKAVWMFDNGGLAAVARQNNVHTNIHRGGADLLYLDGSARWFEVAEYWDFRRDRGRVDNPEIDWSP